VQVIAANIEIPHAKTFSVATLAVYFAFTFVFAALSYGSTIPSGLFTPTLLVGSALGYADCFLLFHIRQRKPKNRIPNRVSIVPNPVPNPVLCPTQLLKAATHRTLVKHHWHVHPDASPGPRCAC
jgi:H+/Cl- antiporter ClcA